MILQMMQLPDVLPSGRTGFDLDEQGRMHVRFVYRLKRELGWTRDAAAAEAVHVAVVRSGQR